MKRWLFNVGAALSLLISLAGAVAWAMSYGSPTWRLIATAHSDDLTRVSSAPQKLLFTTTPNWSNDSHHGFWDAWWCLSQSGRLTFIAQTIDYDGTLRRVYASPPSLTVDLQGEPSRQAVVSGAELDAARAATRLGFATHSASQAVDDGDGIGAPVDARVRMLTLPHWFLVLLGLPLPLRWLRSFRAKNSIIGPGSRVV